MKKLFALIVLLTFALAGSVSAKDHSGDFQMGTFLSATAVEDGTITNTLHGDGTTIAGDVHANQIGVYRIKVADGTWFVTTLSQTQDSMIRGMGMTPMHFKSEKANPLDVLKNGDKVLFRLHERHYVNGKFTLMAIPYADNPNKEVDFSTRFVPDIAPKSTKPTDNVKAMCESGKLSAALTAQYCAVQTPDLTSSSVRTDETLVAQPSSTPVAQISSEPQAVLINQSIVDMVKAGASDDEIITRIKASKTRFDVSGSATAQLMKDAPGITMPVITAMVTSWMHLKQ